MNQNKKGNRPLPPFTSALLSMAEMNREDFDTPGHHGGAFYNLTEEGRLFTKLMGPAPFLADVSDSSSLIGDPSSHEGVTGEAEKMAAKTWGSDECFFVTGGTSASNRICASALLSEGDLVLFDRNNHKSAWQGALIETGAKAVYLPSERNENGIIGPIDEKWLSEDILREEAAKISPAAAGKERPFRLACLQLATYDGLFLNMKEILKRIGRLADYVLLDGAWAGYENFIPLLRDSAILTFPLTKEDPGILVTQSVHKQLAGFSQTSQIHKKDSHIKGEAQYLPHDVLNDAFLMHISTSPYYPLLAGLEMNAFIHQKKGKDLWEKAFRSAIGLKKRLRKETEFFKPFLPEKVDGKDWADFDTETIMKDPAFFTGNKEMGFQSSSLVTLDPCKTLITTGSFTDESHSIPAPLVSSYLESRGITPEKSDFYTLLFLNEPGDTPVKAERLLSALKEFETAYHENRPMKTFLSSISAKPGEGVKDFCCRYSHFLFTKKAGDLSKALFQKEHFPKAPLSARRAHELFVKGKRKKIPLAEAEGHISLENILPYPPGICVLAAGEVWSKTVLDYFLFLEAYGKEFPDFLPEIVGLHREDDSPYVWVG